MSFFSDLILVDHEIKFGSKIIIDGATNLLWATALASLEASETLNAFQQRNETMSATLTFLESEQRMRKSCEELQKPRLLLASSPRLLAVQRMFWLLAWLQKPRLLLSLFLCHFWQQTTRFQKRVLLL